MADVADENAAPAAGRSAARPASGSGSGFWALTLGSVGVVYGDIGTSPLYAFREAVLAAHGDGPVTRDSGARRPVADRLVADHRRDAQVHRDPAARRQQRRGRHALADRAGVPRARAAHPLVLMLGVIGAAMFYGSSLITPALSVLSAVEGLKIVHAGFDGYVLPLAVVILFALFAVQSHGTARVAALFGPVTVIWFVVLAVIGGIHIFDDPAFCRRQSALRRATFSSSNGIIGLRDAGGGVPGGHRRRGAVRRSRPFRPQADPGRLARSWCCRRC